LISLPYETTSRVHHLGAWVQPQIGFTTRFADIGLVSRFHYMSFISVSQRGNFWPSDQQELFYLRANKGNLFWEPGLVFRFGWDYVKAEIQYVASVNMFNENLNYEPLRVGLGLTFLLPPKKK